MGPGPVGEQEVLAYGVDEPPRRPYVAVAAAAAAGLLVGFLAGARTDLLDPPADPASSGRDATQEPAAGRLGADPVAAGIVTRAPGEPGAFEVSLFNTGSADVTATVVSLPGWSPPLADTRTGTIAPRSWGTVRFSAPPDCLAYPADVRVVHVRIGTEEGTVSRVVPLSRPARVLRDHHEELCDPPPTR